MMTENKFVRKDLSSGSFEISLEDNRRNWRVYNVPVELISKYISYAKLHYNNEVWKVMEEGMKLLLERDEISMDIVDRIKNIEGEITALKSIITSEKSKEVCTFGGY